MSSNEIIVVENKPERYIVESVEHYAVSANDDAKYPRRAYVKTLSLCDGRDVYLVDGENCERVTATLYRDRAIEIANDVARGVSVGVDPYGRIPADNFSAFLAKVEKFQRRASKLGKDPMVVETIGIHERRWKETREGGVEVQFVSNEYVIVVRGALPRIDGYSFVGSIDHLVAEDGERLTLLRLAPGESLPASERERGNVCDHCGTSRSRISTCVLRDASGAYKHVGRNCLADFIRSTDVDGLLAYGEFLDVLDECSVGDDEYGSDGGRRVALAATVIDVLRATIAAMAIDGWKPSKFDRPTKVDVSEYLFPPRSPQQDYKDWAAKISERFDAPATVAEAEEALAWARGLSDDAVLTNEYLYNLRTLSKLRAAETKSFGLLCSLIPAFRKEKGREIERKNRRERDAVSEYIGEVKSKLDLAVTLEWFRAFDSNYGVTTLYKFRTEEGNIVVWFASKGIGSDNEEQGARFALRGTVKKHEMRDGVKQTVLTRCSVRKLEAEAEVAQ